MTATASTHEVLRLDVCHMVQAALHMTAAELSQLSSDVFMQVSLGPVSDIEVQLDKTPEARLGLLHRLGAASNQTKKLH